MTATYSHIRHNMVAGAYSNSACDFIASDAQKLIPDAGDLLGLIPGRVTYVFDKTGKCVLSFNSALNANKHVEEALAAVKNLQS